MDLGLNGRVVVVTGGSSGIGLATVERLLAEGASVATCGRDGQRLREALSHLDQSDLLAMTCDVRDRSSCEALAEAVIGRFGRLDGLVNNAGQGRPGGLGDLTDEDWQREIDAKVFGLLNPTKAVLPHLVRSDSGRIVNISASTAREPQAGLLAVSAARAAVSNLSRGLATELAPTGVLVNTVSVGVIATGRAHERHQREAPTASFSDWALGEAAARGVLLGRLGHPDEVAVAISFLVSPLVTYTTGATLEVSGGLTRGW